MATNQDRIASTFLRALGAPDTPAMRAAVKAWLRQEGISSVKRNNPWNLHGGAACGGANDTGKFCSGGVNLPGAIGRYNAGPGDKNVVVFSTLDAGVRANAANLYRLSGSGYGYDRVIAYARKGDPVGFLHALARSSWSAGRYGTKDGGGNKLVKIYNSMTGSNHDPKGYQNLPDLKLPKGGFDLPNRGKQEGPDATGGGSGLLGGWGDHVKLPIGTILTDAHIDEIMRD
jgi:hypothetical protein